MRDNGSMHGTWVNDKKIAPRCDVAINSDDVLTFGAEVTNGPGKPSAIVPAMPSCCMEIVVVANFLQRHLPRSGLAANVSGLILGRCSFLLQVNSC